MVNFDGHRLRLFETSSSLNIKLRSPSAHLLLAIVLDFIAGLRRPRGGGQLHLLRPAA